MASVSRIALLAAVCIGSAAMAEDPQHFPELEAKQTELANYKPLTDADLRNPDPAEWPIYRRNYQGWGFSPLDQIKTDNVGKLRLAWSRVLPAGWQQSTPIMHDGVIFIGSVRDVVQALDARTGNLIWEYRRKYAADPSTFNSLGQNKRSVALYGDKVYLGTWDNHIVALDAKTGRLVWDVDRGQADKGASANNALIVADGVVIAGTSCQYAGFDCYVTGHDAATGKQLWRNHFLPRKGEKGYDTWAGLPDNRRWATGAWGEITYDPELNLVYYGSNGAMPLSEAQRKTPGATMFGTNTRFAVRPKTGETVWTHQVLPRDNWEQDCVFEMLPITTAVNPDAKAAGMIAVGKVKGQTRKVLAGIPCKTGVAFAFDARTGEFLWAKSTVAQNLVKSIDRNGKVTVDEAMVLAPIEKRISQCPSYLGGKDWPTAAYSPVRNVIFEPLNNMCNDTQALPEEPTPEASYNVDFTWTAAPGKENRIGRIDAISAETGRTLWSYEQPGVLFSPVLATAGDLLFTGGMDSKFRALSQADGKVVWETRLPSQVTGHPVSFAIDGRQYIAVPTGGGLVAGYLQSLQPNIDAPVGGNALFVFTLGE